VAVSNARQRAIQAANRLDASRAAYNRSLGRPLTSAVRIAELPLETVDADVESLTAAALRRRPEIARLAVQVRELHNQALSLRAKDRPQFGLWGQYAFEENRFQTPEGIASVGVGVTYDVFDGGRNRREAAALRQRAEGLMRLRADLESRIALQVRRAWLDIQETRRRLEVTSEAIQRAEENLRVASRRYLAGMAINTEVLDAEALRTETRRNHDNAAYDAVLAVLRLRHATGELVP
jgi:outer membrane protein